MPRRSYSVLDLQQTVERATVGDLIHANHILNWANKLVLNGHTLQFPHLDQDLCLGVSVTEKYKKEPHTIFQQGH